MMKNVFTKGIKNEKRKSWRISSCWNITFEYFHLCWHTKVIYWETITATFWIKTASFHATRNIESFRVSPEGTHLTWISEKLGYSDGKAATWNSKVPQVCFTYTIKFIPLFYLLFVDEWNCIENFVQFILIQVYSVYSILYCAGSLRWVNSRHWMERKFPCRSFLPSSFLVQLKRCRKCKQRKMENCLYLTVDVPFSVSSGRVSGQCWPNAIISRVIFMTRKDEDFSKKKRVKSISPFYKITKAIKVLLRASLWTWSIAELRWECVCSVLQQNEWWERRVTRQYKFCAICRDPVWTFSHSSTFTLQTFPLHFYAWT